MLVIARLCLVKLKVLEDHTVSVIHQMLHQECDELVTEEDFLRLEQPNHNKLLRHAKQANARKLLFSVDSQDVIHTMRSGQASYGSQDTKLELREIYINVKLDRSPLSTVTKVEPLENLVHKPFTVTKSVAANLNHSPSIEVAHMVLTMKDSFS